MEDTSWIRYVIYLDSKKQKMNEKRPINQYTDKKGNDDRLDQVLLKTQEFLFYSYWI